MPRRGAATGGEGRGQHRFRFRFRFRFRIRIRIGEIEEIEETGEIEEACCRHRCRRLRRSCRGTRADPPPLLPTGSTYPSLSLSLSLCVRAGITQIRHNSYQPRSCLVVASSIQNTTTTNQPTSQPTDNE